MLVIVHDNDAIRQGSNSGIVEICVARLHADVELHALGMQIA